MRKRQTKCPFDIPPYNAVEWENVEPGTESEWILEMTQRERYERAVQVLEGACQNPTLYRGMSLKGPGSDQAFMNQLREEEEPVHLGSHWSADPDQARYTFGLDVLLTSRFNPRDIDVGQTLWENMAWPDDDEIVLRNGSEGDLIAVEFNPWDSYGSKTIPLKKRIRF